VNDEGAGGVGGVGPIIFSFGVVVMRGAGTARTGEGGERGWGLSQVTRCGLEDAIVVDGCDVRAGGRFGLGQEKAWRQKKCCGLRAERAAGGCHGGLGFRRKSITTGSERASATSAQYWSLI
jgi:hypothetical protein